MPTIDAFDFINQTARLQLSTEQTPSDPYDATITLDSIIGKARMIRLGFEPPAVTIGSPAPEPDTETAPIVMKAAS